MPGNRRRSSTAADSSPRCSIAARIAAASASVTTNIAGAWVAVPGSASGAQRVSTAPSRRSATSPPIRCAGCRSASSDFRWVSGVSPGRRVEARPSTMTSMPKRSASGRRTVSSAAHSATARTDFGLNYSSIRRRENLPERCVPRGRGFVCTYHRQPAPARSWHGSVRNLAPRSGVQCRWPCFPHWPGPGCQWVQMLRRAEPSDPNLRGQGG